MRTQNSAQFCLREQDDKRRKRVLDSCLNEKQYEVATDSTGGEFQLKLPPAKEIPMSGVLRSQTCSLSAKEIRLVRSARANWVQYALTMLLLPVVALVPSSRPESISAQT